MAVTAGSSVSLVSKPQVPGGGQVFPVLQAQDGSFVGTTCPGCPAGDGDIVSFDATGIVRWTVTGDTPYIATADGGVIGQSGTTYDQNGNVTGTMGTLPTYSWTQNWYSSAGGRAAALALPVVEWATSYTAMEGGNPSANGTAVGVAESGEGMPVFALRNRGPSCQLPQGGGTKVSLAGAALAQYNAEKQALLAGGYLTSANCSSFFASTPAASYFSRLTSAVTQQLPVPFDGVQTNISEYAAGFVSAADLSAANQGNPIMANYVKILQGAPVCSDFFLKWRGLRGPGTTPAPLANAESQIHPPAGGTATDVYINTNQFQNITQATVLHEALHNLTGLYDNLHGQSLEALLGLKPKEDCGNGIGTTCITTLLRNRGCAGPN